MQTSSTDAQTVNSAVLRLKRSRDALRLVLHQNSSPPKKKLSTASHFDGAMAAAFNTLMNRPSAQLLSKVVEQLWAKNPWRILGQSVLEASSIVLKPIAQQSPFKLVASAFVLGGILLLVRPWRLMSKRSVISSFLRRWI